MYPQKVHFIVWWFCFAKLQQLSQVFMNCIWNSMKQHIFRMALIVLPTRLSGGHIWWRCRQKEWFIDLRLYHTEQHLQHSTQTHNKAAESVCRLAGGSPIRTPPSPAGSSIQVKLKPVSERATIGACCILPTYGFKHQCRYIQQQTPAWKIARLLDLCDIPWLKSSNSSRFLLILKRFQAY